MQTSEQSTSEQLLGALRESEQRFRATFEQAAVGIAHVGLDGRWLQVNQKLCDIVGYSKEELLERTFQAITYPDDLETDLEYVRQVIRGEIQTYSMEKRYLRKDNSLVWTNLTVSLVREASGEPKYFISVIENIAERKQLEEKLVLSERAAQAIALSLLEANRRMDEFMSIASHELKTPLTTIKGYVQLVARRLKNSSMEIPGNIEQKQALENSWELLERSDLQIERLGRLVNELLDVSRIQADKLELHLEPCDLTTIVQQAVEDQQQEIAGRTIHLKLPSQQTLPVIVDADRIGQVVSNYLSNALKYSSEDRPIEIRLQVEGGSAKVLVRDEGVGLPLEDQEHIWERFYRAEGIEVQSGSGAGLGLGLYICRTIIERHSGQVGVESTPDAGSTFWFSLPLAQPESPTM